MGLFVTLEGIEGAGKSTLRSSLAELGKELGREIVITREPGATCVGRAIRSLLLNPENKEITPLAELMLFAADRAQHLSEVIRPAIKRGAIVICDRYIHSTLAYQGYGRQLELDNLVRLNQVVTEGLMPDLVLLLDLDPKIGLERAKRRVERATASFNLADLKAGNINAVDRFEEQELEFHERIRNGFLEMAKEPENKFCIIDASKSPEEIEQQAATAIKAIL